MTHASTNSSDMLEIDRERTGDLIVCQFVDRHSLFLRVIHSELQYRLVSYVPISVLQSDNVTTTIRNLATFDCSPIVDRIQFAFMFNLITLLVMLVIFALRGVIRDCSRRHNRQKLL
jgi:sulfate adenylyltransferase subunit 1 (EFTu-like GTPase family)